MASATTDRRLGLTSDKGVKAPVTAVALSNVVLSGEQTIDGYACKAVNSAGYADRVLCTAQTNPIENGPWDVSTAAWSRSIDGNGSADFSKGTLFVVVEGTQAGIFYRVTSNNPVLPGTNPITIGLVPGASAVALAGQLADPTSAANGAGIPAFNWSLAYVTPSAGNALKNRALCVTDYPYLAKGDGTIDDTAAILAAVATGADVFFPHPSSYYKTTAAIVPLAGQTLFGAGKGTQIQCSAAASNAIQISVANVTVRDLFVKHTGSNPSGTTGNAIAILSGASYATIRNNRLEATQGGVTISQANDNRVEGNDITLITDTVSSWDIAVYGGGDRNNIIANRCLGGGATGIEILSGGATSANKNLVAYNLVGAHTVYGIISYSQIDPSNCTDTTITGNHIYDINGSGGDAPGSRSKGSGIYVQSSENAIVTSNWLKNTNIGTDVQTLAPGAIGVNGTKNVTIADNTIVAPVWYGIYVTTPPTTAGLPGSIIVRGNSVVTPTKDGISFTNVTDIIVEGNSVDQGAASGIAIQHSSTATGVVVTGNKVKQCTAGTGLTINNCTYPLVSNNSFQTSLNGMIYANNVGGAIVGNMCLSNTSNDLFINSNNSGLVHCDRNTVIGTGTNGLNDIYGACYGINNVSGQTNPYGTSTKALEPTLATAVTQSVLGMRMANYGGATAVTDLTNPYPGQIITIRATGACTYQHNTGASSTKLLLNGGVNFVMATNNTLTLLYAQNGPWFEISRKV